MRKKKKKKIHCFPFPFKNGHRVHREVTPPSRRCHLRAMSHTNTPDTGLDQGQGPEVSLEFGHDKSPLNLSS